jgi:hypothetical protein
VRPADVEAWVQTIVDAVLNGRTVEYDRVELKAQWPASIQGAARRLGAHANTARGDTILWIIGLDERNRSVHDVEPNELANWVAAVQAEFRGVSPQLITQVTTFSGDKHLAGLLFETDRAPYVVKNPSAGKEGCGPVELEVPWREGTRTRTARHEDLMRILVPAVRVPSIEVLAASVFISEEGGPNGPAFSWWDVRADVYFSTRSADRVIIPLHRSAITIALPTRPPLEILAHHVVLERRPKRGYPWDPPAAREIPGESVTVTTTESELVLDGPGAVRLTAVITSKMPIGGITDSIELSGQFLPTDATQTAAFSEVLKDDGVEPGKRVIAGRQVVRGWAFNRARWIPD